jgi:hypothetical protein
MRNKKGRHCRPFSLGRSKRLEVLDQVVPLFRVEFQVARMVVVHVHVRDVAAPPSWKLGDVAGRLPSGQ